MFGHRVRQGCLSWPARRPWPATFPRLAKWVPPEWRSVMQRQAPNPRSNLRVMAWNDDWSDSGKTTRRVLTAICLLTPLAAVSVIPLFASDHCVHSPDGNRGTIEMGTLARLLTAASGIAAASFAAW